METIHELIPFAKEMLSQKPNRKMVKLSMLGSVLAFFGVVTGLVETVCSPLSGSPLCLSLLLGEGFREKGPPLQSALQGQHDTYLCAKMCILEM
uniref:G0/G1 switch protein 2 n=1 Tax=Apteryx owenii TaxID=8824 RepID=A0A8B9PBB1_APTOW